MRTFKRLSDPKAYEAIADETRRRMIYLLRAKDMTVSQLAEALGKTSQAMYHQIRILLDAGMVEVAREERVEHFIETYYRATAEVFEFSHGELSGKEMQKGMKEILELLASLGLPVSTDDESVERMIRIERRQTEIPLPRDLEEKIAKYENAGTLEKQHAYKFAQLATMTDKQFEEMLNAERDLRDFLVTKKAKPIRRRK